MVLSSFNALNKIEAGGMRELNSYITRRLNSDLKAVERTKPLGLHFLVEEKIFMGTNQPFVSCPIQFLLRDRSLDTKLCRPVWTDSSQRTKVNRKARFGVKKRSVIRVDDYSVVRHENAVSGYVVFLRSYLVVKKEVDEEAYHRWLRE
jgi:hypothetical protein